MIYRPFHFTYVKKIIKTHLSHDNNVVVNHYNSHFKIVPDDGVQQMINLPQKFLQKAIGVRNVKKQLLKLAREGREVNVFIPHTLGILSNYAYYRLATKYKNIRINIFYEGVIVFYGYDHDYMENLWYYVSRWFVSLFSGISYTIDKRLLDLNDDRIKKIYTPFHNLDTSPGKIIDIGLEKINFEPQKKSCLIVGLKLDDKFMDELPRIIRAIYNKLDELQIKTIFFKEHPSDKCELFFTIAEEMGKKLHVINDISPIETIIADYRPEYVISSWSSAIINLSNMLPDTVGIYCFLTEKITAKAEEKKLVMAFREQKINVVYV
jgi:hypothetical protein